MWSKFFVKLFLLNRECTKSYEIRGMRIKKDFEPTSCASKVDVIFVLDSSGSLGLKVWDATQDFAKNFVIAFLHTYLPI